MTKTGPASSIWLLGWTHSCVEAPYPSNVHSLSPRHHHGTTTAWLAGAHHTTAQPRNPQGLPARKPAPTTRVVQSHMLSCEPHGLCTYREGGGGKFRSDLQGTSAHARAPGRLPHLHACMRACTTMCAAPPRSPSPSSQRRQPDEQTRQLARCTGPAHAAAAACPRYVAMTMTCPQHACVMRMMPPAELRTSAMPLPMANTLRSACSMRARHGMPCHVVPHARMLTPRLSGACSTWHAWAMQS